MLASVLSGAAAVGAAVTAGVYVNFSARVMPRLGALPDSEGIAAMQRFNRAAVQAPFMTAFFGAAALSVVLVVRTARDPERSVADWLSGLGAGLYLAGFVLTIAYHVPRNDRLAALDPVSPLSTGVWRTYLAEWTSANSVRAGLSAAATVALVSAAVAFLSEG